MISITKGRDNTADISFAGIARSFDIEGVDTCSAGYLGVSIAATTLLVFILSLRRCCGKKRYYRGKSSYRNPSSRDKRRKNRLMKQNNINMKIIGEKVGVCRRIGLLKN